MMNMVRLEHPEYLWLLMVLPVLLLLFLVNKWSRLKTLNKLGEERLVKLLVPEMPKSKYVLKYVMLSIAFVLLVIGLANPQIGTKTETVTRKGVNVVIALDVSKSMLAEDMRPNRLERSKRMIDRLMDNLQNDRVGLVLFAGNAYLQVPLTIDYSAVRLFLKNANTQTIPTQGTDIGAAIHLAEQMFDADETKHKALIVITDGESHTESVMEDAKRAEESGIVIHTVGVGSPKGAPIPVPSRGGSFDFKKDNDGNIVLSKLDEPTLQQIAALTDGNYFHLTGGQDQVRSVSNALAAMEKVEMEERVFTDYEDHFQFFLIPAFLIFLLEMFLSFKRTRLFKSEHIFYS